MSKYLLLASDILPEVYELVLKAKEEVDKGRPVSTVCKELDISRSTFYKYKDKVFYYEQDKYLKLKMIFNKEKTLVNKIVILLNNLGVEIQRIEKEDVGELSLIRLITLTGESELIKESLEHIEGFIEFID